VLSRGKIIGLFMNNSLCLEPGLFVGTEPSGRISQWNLTGVHRSFIPATNVLLTCGSSGTVNRVDAAQCTTVPMEPQRRTYRSAAMPDGAP
jgi:hypothetical protein